MFDWKKRRSSGTAKEFQFSAFSDREKLLSWSARWWSTPSASSCDGEEAKTRAYEMVGGLEKSGEEGRRGESILLADCVIFLSLVVSE